MVLAGVLPGAVAFAVRGCRVTALPVRETALYVWKRGVVETRWAPLVVA